MSAEPIPFEESVDRVKIARRVVKAKRIYKPGRKCHPTGAKRHRIYMTDQESEVIAIVLSALRTSNVLRRAVVEEVNLSIE